MTQWKCAHGFTLSERCAACDLDNARDTVNRWGDAVDEARKVIARAEKEWIRSLPNLQDQLVSEGMDADAARDHVCHLIDEQSKNSKVKA
jgi:hypothetical protein